MKKRITALLLSLAMVFALGAPQVLAEGDAAMEGTPAARDIEAAEDGQAAEAARSAVPAEDEQAAGAAEADAETENVAENGAEDSGETAPSDPEGTLAFTSLRTRMLENYYPLRALQESIDDIESHDYDWRYDRLRTDMNKLATAQWGLRMIFDYEGSAMFGAQYDQMRKEFDAIKDGEKQKDDEEALRQYRNAQNQAVIAGESLYIMLKGLEAQDATLARTIAQLGRSEREMRLRHELGQISELVVDQVSTGRAQAVSGRETLRMNRETALLQLESWVGAELGEPLALGALPKVTAQELAAMDLEADLEKARSASYALFDAKKQLDDFRKNTYDKVIDAYGLNEKYFEVSQVKHALQAQTYNYENTLLTFELNFRTLYAQVKDCAQVLEAKRTALAGQEKSYAVSALKYKQGNISANALADAEDELSSAKDEVASAERELFSKYRSYTWAVDYGILNG